MPNTSVPSGLTKKEAWESRKKYGKNSDKALSFITAKIILKAIFSFYNILITALVIILLLINQVSTAEFMSIIGVTNLIIELVQIIRARIIIKRLRRFLEKNTKAVRDGKIEDLAVEDLLIGDVIFLESGDRVPVDGEVILSQYAEFDESILTGESNYLEKESGDQIRAGSFVTAGKCYYKMTKFFRDSYIRVITKQIAKQEITQSPLESQINQIVRLLTYITVFFIAVIIAEGLVQQSQKEEIILNTATLVSSLIPQGLVLITTMSFAYGAIKMAKNQAIVQRLSSIEAMADANVVCFDKTGTLTRNELEVKDAVWFE